jgi:hypothetical protein
MSRFQVVGVNDAENFCECCGKSNLKQVVWIQDNDLQEIKHFGTTCALSPVKGFGADKEIKSAIKDFRAKRQAILWVALRAYKKAGGTMIGNSESGWTYADKELHKKCIEETEKIFTL